MNERDLGKCRLRTGRRMTSALVSLGSRAICVRSCSPCRHVNWVASFCGEEVDVWWAGESAAVYLAAHLLVCWVSATANCCGGAVFTHCQRFPNTLCLWLLQSDLNVFERVCVCVCVRESDLEQMAVGPQSLHLSRRTKEKPIDLTVCSTPEGTLGTLVNLHKIDLLTIGSFLPNAPLPSLDSIFL